jgi:hypothetical protein
MRRTPRFIAGAGLVLVMTTPALAYSPLIPGHMCRYYGTQSADSYFTPEGYKANGLKNTSSSSRYVTCGIPKELDEDITEVVISLSTSSDVCKLYTRSRTAGDYSVYTVDTILNWNGSYAHDFYLNGYYFEATWQTASVYCNVPSGAVINAYEMTPH